MLSVHDLPARKMYLHPYMKDWDLARDMMDLGLVLCKMAPALVLRRMVPVLIVAYRNMERDVPFHQ